MIMKGCAQCGYGTVILAHSSYTISWICSTCGLMILADIVSDIMLIVVQHYLYFMVQCF